jgi:hypothetical protein
MQLRVREDRRGEDPHLTATGRGWKQGTGEEGTQISTCGREARRRKEGKYTIQKGNREAEKYCVRRMLSGRNQQVAVSVVRAVVIRLQRNELTHQQVQPRFRGADQTESGTGYLFDTGDSHKNLRLLCPWMCVFNECQCSIIPTSS